MSDPSHAEAARWDAVEEASELLHEGDAEAALPLLRATLDRDPGNPYAHYLLGAALRSGGNYGPAAAAFIEAERVAPDYLGAIVALGEAWWKLGRHDAAVHAGERALKKRPDDPDALFLLGNVHAERGDIARAVVYLERFLELDPTVEARYEAEALLSAVRGKLRHLEPV